MSALEAKVIALAGVFQASRLVQDVAHTGTLSPQPLSASVESIFRIDADSVAAVYGGLAGVRYGLESVRDQLGATRAGADPERMRYVANLLHLERRLVAAPQILSGIRAGILDTQALVEQLPVTHEDVLARLADVYTRTVSTIGPRILVNGKPEHLNIECNANRVRALLLAGVRAAVLWRQLGGGRIGLLLSRHRISDTARVLLG